MSFERPIKMLHEGLGNTIYGPPSSSGGGGGTVLSVGAENGAVARGTATNPIIEWGQNSGEVGNPGRLLHDTEIPMNGFVAQWIGSLANEGIEFDSSGDIQLTGFVGVGGLFSPNAYTFFFGTPNNYGTVYPGHGIADQFYAGWERFDGVNTYPRPNVVGQFWAYNYNTGGGRIVAGEAGFGFRTETDFDLNAGGQDYFELHLPEVSVPGPPALTFRPWSFYISKVTGATIHQSQVQSFNFNTKNDNITYFQWDTNATGNPTGDMQNQFTATGRGTHASTTWNFNDFDNAWGAGMLQWDRGSWTLSLDGNAPSWDNWLINVIGNVQQQGTIASGQSFISCVSLLDRPTTFVAFLSSATTNNNPTYGFDRRVGGSLIIGNGTNGGEVAWGSGDRSLNLQGIGNGTASGGSKQCFDFHVNAIDPADSLNHDNMIVTNAGQLQVPRGGVQTADPGLGAAIWLLGNVQATVAGVVDATRYVQASIGGTVVKLAVLV